MFSRFIVDLGELYLDSVDPVLQTAKIISLGAVVLGSVLDTEDPEEAEPVKSEWADFYRQGINIQ